MKKFLSILSILLVVCMCLASCNLGDTNKPDTDNNSQNTQVGSGGNGGNSGNNSDDKKPNNGGSGDSVQALIDLFAKSGELGDLLENLDTEVDIEGKMDEVYAEILKIQYEGNVDMDAILDEANGHVDGYLGIKDGNIAVNLNASSSDFNGSSSAYGFFTDDLKFVLVSVDEEGHISSQVTDIFEDIDLEEGKEELEDMLEGSMMDTIKDFKLPELTKKNIELKDGVYVISKDYWKEAANYTIDVIKDFMAESGENIDEEEFAESREMMNKALEAVDFSLGFHMDGSNLVGFALKVDMNYDDLVEIMGENADDDFHSFVVDIDVKAKGDFLEYVKVFYDVDSDEGSQKVDFKFNTIYGKEDKIAGFTTSMVFDMIDSYYDYSDYGESKEIIQNVNVGATATLNTNNLDKNGQEVFHFALESKTVENGVLEYGLDINAGMTSKGKDKLEFTFGFADSNQSVEVNGTLEYSENANNFPKIPENVLAERDEALYNHENGISKYPEYGTNEKVEVTPEPEW